MLFNPLPSNFRPYDGTRLSRGRTRADVALFNESQSRSVPHTRLGEVTKDPTLTIEATGKTFAWPLEKLRTPFEKTIPSLMSWEK